MSKKIYLSGSIDGLNLGQAKVWRELATQRLEQLGFTTGDPTLKIHKKFLSQKRMMDMDYKKLEDTAQEIVKKDKAMIRTCDLLLCNLSGIELMKGDEAPVGTLMELYYAFAELKMPTFVVAQHKGYLNRPWLKAHMTKSFSTLDKAIVGIVQYFK